VNSEDKQRGESPKGEEMKVRVSIELMKKLIEVAGEVENFSPAGVSECLYEVENSLGLVVNNGKEIYAMIEVE
jgi:hypothetical protein